MASGVGLVVMLVKKWDEREVVLRLAQQGGLGCTDFSVRYPIINSESV